MSGNHLIGSRQAMGSPRDAELERMIEMRVAMRAEADAVRWRFRLIAIEAVLMVGLVTVGGLALDQRPLLVMKTALLVGAACLGSGILLIGLSAVSGRLLSGLRRWRSKP